MTIFLTAILVIAAFVIGVLVGRILKMSFGCNSQDSQSQTAMEPKQAASSTTNVSSGNVSAATSANLVSSNPEIDVDVKGPEKVSGSKPKKSAVMAKETAATKTTAAKIAATKTAATKTAAAKPTAAKPVASKTTVAKTVAKSTKAAPAKTKATTTAAKSSSVAKKSAPPAKSKAVSASKKTSVKTAAMNATSDDLKLIKGVGKANEVRLNDEGITSFAQVAAWKKGDITEFDEKLNFKGRIDREEWVPQAKALAKANAKSASAKTTPAKPAASKKAPAKKASVKKAAPKTEVKKATPKASPKKATLKKAAPKKAAPKAAAKKPTTPDDLKLIKGVGKLIETKLAKEGITNYAQIAAWKKADITEFDEKLSFKGRIDRDDWIKQAKVLEKGGTTEFSKRAAKGEVPSSS